MSDPLADCSGVSEAELTEVLALIAGTDIVELDLAFGASRLTVRRPPVLGATSAPPELGAPVHDTRSLAIASPLVGVFHPSVAVGDVVSAGQVIGAIEALGMPTTVDAPQPGTVEDLLAVDGSAVEYGQPLVLLRRPAEA